MGANQQTSVPAFTAGQILTAQQQTEINTGIPVFADSTARDAAFGGTGEKVLAEGQFAYLEDSNIVQYYDGASWASVGPTFTNAVVATSQSTTSTSYVDLSTVGAEVTVTTGTTAFVIITSNLYNNTTNQKSLVSFAVSGATTVAASDASCIELRNNIAGGQELQASAVYKVTLTPGSNTFTMKYRVTSGTGYFANRGITVISV